MGTESVFSSQSLDAALLVSLFSVAVLVALFFYLNRYTQRNYFTIWATAWLFYALWLTLRLTAPEGMESFVSFAGLLCIETSAVFLLWGSFRFLRLQAPQKLMGLFLGFLYVWSYVAPKVFDDSLRVELPVFALIGLASLTAGAGFLVFREHRRFVGANLLAAGFVLWGACLISHPLLQGSPAQSGSALFISAAVQLFIAVSMIILVLEEVRYNSGAIIDEIHSVKSEKEQLRAKVQESEQRLQTLFGDARLKDELQHAYEELRATHRKVVEQERLSVLGQIASGMAHDINNALTPLIGFSDILLESRENLPEDMRESVAYISKAGRDIESIVKRVRQFYRGRSDSESLGNVDLNRLVRETAEARESEWKQDRVRAGRRCNFDLQLSEGLPEIKGSEEELREVFSHLIRNAEEAMPEGGSIEIRTGIREATEGIGDPSEGARVVVVVKDHGKGMDAATRGRCIEPFFTTKNPRHPGLGLATVYGAMQRHDGTLEIVSEPGQGTQVTVDFPLISAGQPAAAERERPVRPLRLLCVDDEPLVLMLLKDVLQMYGHSVETANGGADGIKAFEAAHAGAAPFQAVITDLGMPDLDGWQVVQAIKQCSPQTPVILLTGWANLLEKKDVLEKVDAVLKKPLSMAQMEAVLRRFGNAGCSASSTARFCADTPPVHSQVNN
jgi:signal transduction histidine kinase/ActR/RegA family two-component response regulator